MSIAICKLMRISGFDPFGFRLSRCMICLPCCNLSINGLFQLQGVHEFYQLIKFLIRESVSLTQ